MSDDINVWIQTLGPQGLLAALTWYLLKEVKPALEGLRTALVDQTKVNVAVLEYLRKGGG